MENCITPHKVALGAANGNVDFHYASENKENQGMGSLVSADNNVATRMCRVDVSTLDQFVKTTLIQKIDLIKVDIQGGEIDFLHGAERTLRSLRPDLVVEISASDLAATGRNPKDLISMIEELGYRIYEIRKNGRLGNETKSYDRREPKGLNVYCKAFY